MWRRLPARITLSHPQSGNRKRFDAAHCISYDQPGEHSQISTFCQPGHPRHGQSAAERGRAVACARLQSGSMASSSSEPWHPLAVGRGAASPSESQLFGSSACCTCWGFGRKNEEKLLVSTQKLTHSFSRGIPYIGYCLSFTLWKGSWWDWLVGSEDGDSLRWASQMATGRSQDSTVWREDTPVCAADQDGTFCIVILCAQWI